MSNENETPPISTPSPSPSLPAAPAEPGPSGLQVASAFLANPTVRRIACGALTGLTVVLNKKLGLDLPAEDLYMLVAMCISYIATSNWKDAQVQKAQSAAASVNITTVEQAIARMEKVLAERAAK